MTFDQLKRFALFLKQKYPTGGAIKIASPVDGFMEEWVSIDWEIRPIDVEEFMRQDLP